jgi:four helix bundle protein
MCSDEQISLDLHLASLKFPKIEQFGGLADQMRRASKSVCANLAEGFGKQRQSNLEFKRYLLMAIGSADEIQVWLKYCSDLEYIDQKNLRALAGRISPNRAHVAEPRHEVACSF